MSNQELGQRIKSVLISCQELIPNHHPIEVLEEIVAMAKNEKYEMVLIMLNKSLNKKSKIKNQ